MLLRLTPLLRRPASRPRWGVRCLATASEFAAVPQAPPDPILGITEAFKACSAPDKLNLGVGAYRNENLQPVVLEARANARACAARQHVLSVASDTHTSLMMPLHTQVVKLAEQRLLARELSGADNKEYLGMEGLPAFNRLSAQLLFGGDSPALAQGRVVTIQGLSVRFHVSSAPVDTAYTACPRAPARCGWAPPSLPSS